jgi:hypothetical protein
MFTGVSGHGAIQLKRRLGCGMRRMTDIQSYLWDNGVLAEIQCIFNSCVFGRKMVCVGITGGLPHF